MKRILLCKEFYCIILLSFLALCTDIKGQVTIGSGIEPTRATLLDLKSKQELGALSSVSDPKNVTSSDGGFLLPRVELVDITTLEPFIPATDPEFVNNTNSLKEKLAGLMVFNIADTDSFSPAVYTWDGSRWISLKPTELPESPITLNNPHYILLDADYPLPENLLQAPLMDLVESSKMNEKGQHFVLPEDGRYAIFILPYYELSMSIDSHYKYEITYAVGKKGADSIYMQATVGEEVSNLTGFSMNHLVGKPAILQVSGKAGEAFYLKAYGRIGFFTAGVTGSIKLLRAFGATAYQGTKIFLVRMSSNVSIVE